MSRWFRHYAGMMRDDKLVRISIKTKQTIERVLWVWGAMLESAAECDDGGKFDFDADEAAYFLRSKPAAIRAIMEALEAAGHTENGAISKWKTRQFQSDKSRDRVAAHRAKKRSGNVTDDSECNGGVTLQERHGNPPETETETEVTLANANDVPSDSDLAFWANAKSYLGKSKAPVIGKWVRDHGREETAKAITAAQMGRIVDPVPYIEKCLRGAGKETLFSGPC